MCMQNHGPPKCIAIRFVETIEFESKPKLSIVFITHFVFAERSASTTNLVTVFPAFQPVLIAMAMGYQAGFLNAVFGQVINKKPVFTGRQAHVNQKTNAIIIIILLRKNFCFNRLSL